MNVSVHTIMLMQIYLDMTVIHYLNHRDHWDLVAKFHLDDIWLFLPYDFHDK